jgi:hypothetical protein
MCARRLRWNPPRQTQWLQVKNSAHQVVLAGNVKRFETELNADPFYRHYLGKRSIDVLKELRAQAIPTFIAVSVLCRDCKPGRSDALSLQHRALTHSVNIFSVVFVSFGRVRSDKSGHGC